MSPRATCPVCHRSQRVNADGTFRKHTRDTTVWIGERAVYDAAPCDGSGREVAK